MADVAAQRQALVETRARLDHHLDELAQQLPDRDAVIGTATRIAAAAGGLVAGIGVVVVLTRSKLAKRRDHKQARAYAEALVTALPEVATAWAARSQDAPTVVAPVRADPPAPVVDGLVEALDLDDAVVAGRERGGAPTAILMGLGVVGGVALSRFLNEG